MCGNRGHARQQRMVRGCLVGWEKKYDKEERGRGEGLRAVHHHHYHYRLRFIKQEHRSTGIPSGAGSEGDVREGLWSDS